MEENKENNSPETPENDADFGPILDQTQSKTTTITVRWKERHLLEAIIGLKDFNNLSDAVEAIIITYIDSLTSAEVENIQERVSLGVHKKRKRQQSLGGTTVMLPTTIDGRVVASQENSVCLGCDAYELPGSETTVCPACEDYGSRFELERVKVKLKTK